MARRASLNDQFASAAQEAAPQTVKWCQPRVKPPVEIKESLVRFRKDHPVPSEVAFTMMKFGGTTSHKRIVEGIHLALQPHGIGSVRADDKQYHDDLYYNILTYIYGSGFGIAVFERIEAEEFNPNVALEVGYFTALGKPVCLLKDKTLRTLHADLIGKLYRPFDPQDPAGTIAPELTNWMRDKGIIKVQRGDERALNAYLSDLYWSQLCGLLGQTLEGLFGALMEEVSVDDFIVRSIPNQERRRAFVHALQAGGEYDSFLKKANHLRRLAGSPPFVGGLGVNQKRGQPL
jgi:nucleoside 2-deoxyribosyltransferase